MTDRYIGVVPGDINGKLQAILEIVSPLTKDVVVIKNRLDRIEAHNASMNNLLQLHDKEIRNGGMQITRQEQRISQLEAR